MHLSDIQQKLRETQFNLKHYIPQTNGLYTDCTRFTINLEKSAINVACVLNERTN